MSPPAPFGAGSVLAERYRLIRPLGTGAIGQVYQAEDVILGDVVAVKMLRPELLASGVVLERFRREIQLSRRVTHVNVCRVFNLGIHQEGPRRTLFLTMELLSGRSLAEHLQGSPPFDPHAALPIVAQVAAGLQAAHDAGVIHRDLKPGNVMLLDAPPGRTVITDFGVARSLEEAGGGLTQSGEMVGTPAYMAPEQVMSQEISAATDIYALGVMIYEMLSGRLPFAHGRTEVATALKRLDEPPVPLSEAIPDIDPLWEETVARCLERDPRRRFRRAADVASALRSAPSPDGTAGADGRRRRGGA